MNSVRFTIRTRLVLPLVTVALFTVHAAQSAAVPEGRLQLRVLGANNGRPVPCRIHLIDAAGKPVRAPALPFWHDHFVCTGAISLALAPGPYRWQIERGPEWSRATGTVEVVAGSTTPVEQVLRRLVDLSLEGWWSGETHVHRPAADAELLMRAEDLSVARVISWWNKVNPWSMDASSLPPQPIQFDQSRFYHSLGGEDERDGGALLFLDLPVPLEITAGTRHYPSSLVYARDARRRGAAWIDAEKPFWWDFPMWVAHGVVDTVGLANNHLHRSGVLGNEAWGRPRDPARYPGPQGNGRYTQDIYYHLLNGGVRLAPSAGSASGVLPNPVGYNRAYVHLDGALTEAKWQEGLKAGRSFVSNGPLLRARANGQWPGHGFRNAGPLTVRLEAQLDSQDPLAAVELVRNGEVQTVTLPVTFTVTNSGWFLLRVVAAVPTTFRFASTAPWHVELDGRPMTPNRASVQFFAGWCEERLRRLNALTEVSSAQKEELVQPWRKASEFWRRKLE